MAYTPFKFFTKNRTGRDFVVGDIHGSFTALESLLQQIHFAPAHDRVFSVGDLIDRGTESYRAIEFLNYPWFHAIMGNHEQMLLDANHDEIMRESWIDNNGGAWWQRIPPALQSRIYQIIAQLPVAFEVATANGQIGIVHADIPYATSWKDFIQALNRDSDIVEYALWSRKRYKNICMTGGSSPIEGIDLVVFGHTPLTQPLHVANMYYIDTGAPFRDEAGLGKLTLLEIQPQLAIHQLDTRTLTLLPSAHST
ncbi:MAG: metallophosphoesterase [Thiothrix sp.]|uniref:metallophosphoesterase n=1 Tax=Thiothrix sp. TaxID=1032 RepID=UPI00262BDB71|nr:metallophosphoesterase [Thiothrix sp.]MDD5393735.1 metallophosphoesterase [Thiothrix sp.]